MPPSFWIIVLAVFCSEALFAAGLWVARKLLSPAPPYDVKLMRELRMALEQADRLLVQHHMRRNPEGKLEAEACPICTQDTFDRWRALVRRAG